MHLWESTEVDGSAKTVRGGGPLAGDIIRSVEGVLLLTGHRFNNFSFGRVINFIFLYYFYREDNNQCHFDDLTYF